MFTDRFNLLPTTFIREKEGLLTETFFAAEVFVVVVEEVEVLPPTLGLVLIEPPAPAPISNLNLPGVPRLKLLMAGHAVLFRVPENAGWPNPEFFNEP
jgi:hypothetical protein